MGKGRKPEGPKGPYPNRIAVLRSERGFTQATLADAMSALGSRIERGYVQKLEGGKHQLSDDMLGRLCSVLECEPWEVDPARFRLTDEDVEALTINRHLTKDPERRARWIGIGADMQKASGQS